ncbi:MAG: Electron transfer flavoprotein subunit alpha [Gammaproteobacteria bacterium]|nr:Electron transfer flavoprotein subunit alpha [Gammaproteobacteria bacterium]
MSAILVIAEHRRGVLRPVTLELVTAALAVREELRARVEIAIIGGGADALTPALSLEGVDELLLVPTPIDAFQPECHAAAGEALIAARRPRLVLIPHSVDGISYAPAIAATGGHGYASDVSALRCEGADIVATRSAYREKARVELDFPGRQTVVITVRPGSFLPATRAGGGMPVTTLAVPGVPLNSEHCGFIEPEPEADVDVSAAEFLVAVGRGIGEQAMTGEVAQLAGRMGATLACSRPIVDAGWLPKSRQIGQSGRTATNCRLYLALGISGAVQHLAGMKHVETVIAVNRDPDAAIFSVARFGLVADVAELVAELRALFP